MTAERGVRGPQAPQLFFPLAHGKKRMWLHPGHPDVA